MKRILVSGASGIVGYGILRSLRKSGKDLLLIGTTIYDDSVAAGFCDIFEQAIPTNDERYLEWLGSVIQKHRVDFILPGIEADLYKWVENSTIIERSGARILLNSISLISLCKDKWLFYENLIAQGSPMAIRSSLSADFDILSNEFGLPFILKPRRGFGSKGIVCVDSEETFDKHKANVGALLMAQEFVGNEEEEFTTSAFCDGKGGFFCHMTLKRKLSKEGFTEKAEVIEPAGIKDAIRSLCEIYRPEGPTNFQFRMHKGNLKLLEINPRISSATSIRTAFGYNESAMAVEYFLENRNPAPPIIRKGKAVRYVDDFIFYS